MSNDVMVALFVLLSTGYIAAVAIWFSVKLNRRDVVETGHVASGPIDAIQFFWRPG